MPLKRIALTSALLMTATLPVLGQSIWDKEPMPNPVGDAATTLRSSVDARVIETMRNANAPGMTVAITKNGQLVYDRGFGYANWADKVPMTHRHRGAIGSSTKVLTTLGMMRLIADEPALTLRSRVYGENGILADGDYADAIRQGNRRHYPILGMSIGQNNRVITWFSDGQFTIGNSQDLDRHQAPRSYKLPDGQEAADVLGIARGGPHNRVYSWYRDGTVSVGTPTDLDAHGTTSGFASRRKDLILAIAAHTSANVFYAFYHDGRMSSGDSPSDLINRWRSRPYVVPGAESRRYDIVGLARSNNDVMVAWYSDRKVSKGNADDLGRILQSDNYERRGVPGAIHRWNVAYRDIEVRHLLSHTAGFTRSGQSKQAEIKYALVPAAANWPPYKRSNAYVLSTRPLLFEPGTRSSYSNHGMGLTGHLIETVSGRAWDDFLHEHVFLPAGAGGIRPIGTFNDAAIDARYHAVRKQDDVPFVRTQDVLVRHGPGSAAGSLKATARDLVSVMVATDGQPNRPDILPADTLEAMEIRPFPEAAPGRAHGWGIVCDNPCDGRLLWHNGKSRFGTSYLAKYDGHRVGNDTLSGITVAVVMNRGNGSTAALSRLARDIALSAHRATVFQDFFRGGLE